MKLLHLLQTRANVSFLSFREARPYDLTYKCKMDGHDSERGIINVFAVLAAANVALANANNASR